MQCFFTEIEFVLLAPILPRGHSTFFTENFENGVKQWSEPAALQVTGAARPCDGQLPRTIPKPSTRLRAPIPALECVLTPPMGDDSDEALLDEGRQEILTSDDPRLLLCSLLSCPANIELLKSELNCECTELVTLRHTFSGPRARPRCDAL